VTHLSLSVIIPTHNRLPVLLRALHNLSAGQDVPDEVIVVDDCSTEPVEPHLAGLRSKLPSLRILRQDPNRGAAVARNTGLRAATSDVLVLMDDDVLSEPTTIKAHRRLHEEHSEDCYGVMGRIMFDPELPYTSLMRWLETVGDFKSIANGVDGELQPGLISANFSVKRAFIARQPVLFDEGFTIYNEDTEFGFRMVCEQGWNLRYHTAPAARHHSPMSFEKYWGQIYSSGVSKTHWSLVQPDVSRFSLTFGQAFLMKLREKVFRSRFRATQAAFGVDLNGPDTMSAEKWSQFDTFMRFSRQALQDIGQFDGWLELAASVSAMVEDLERGFRSGSVGSRLRYFRNAHEHDPEFFPMAWLYCEQLASSASWSEVDRVMRVFADNNWALLARCGSAFVDGRHNDCVSHAQRVIDQTEGKPIPDVVRQRNIAEMWLKRVSSCSSASSRAILADDQRGDWRDGLHRAVVWNSRKKLGPCETGSSSKCARDLTEVTQTALPECSLEELVRPGTERGPQPCTRGTIQWYSPEKKFGFIRPARGDRLLMFDKEQTEGLGDTICPGAQVTFKPVDTRLGRQARDLRWP
jgi:GT2 family glycosyltransferase/cold shock CspA family protein